MGLLSPTPKTARTPEVSQLIAADFLAAGSQLVIRSSLLLDTRDPKTQEVTAPAFVRPTSSQRRNPSHAQHTSWGRSELTLSSPKPRKSLALVGAASPPSFFGQRPREGWRRAAVPPPRSHTHTRATSSRPCSLASLGGRAKLSSSKVRGWSVRIGEPSPCRSPLARLSPAGRPLTLRHAPQTPAKKKAVRFRLVPGSQ